jgi:hypothetical protein
LDDPMNTESEVFQQAVTLVNEHGEDAPIHAATRAQALLDQGDRVGHALWQRIGNMSNVLLSRTALLGAKVP